MTTPEEIQSVLVAGIQHAVNEFGPTKVRLRGVVSAEGEKWIELELIRTPEEFRGQGHAEATLAYLCVWLDELRWNAVLTPSRDFGASVTKLKAFYRRHGFIQKPAREFAIRGTMVRYHE